MIKTHTAPSRTAARGSDSFVSVRLALLALGMLALAAGLTSCATADKKPAPSDFLQADANGDGKVTREEWSEYARKRSFARLDANNDGRVDAQEWVRLDDRPDARQRFAGVDADRNGSVTFAEFSAADKARGADVVFLDMDRNGDGALSPEELDGRPSSSILSVRF